MNWKQKICLWIGISVIVLMGLFPPWIVGSQLTYKEAIIFEEELNIDLNTVNSFNYPICSEKVQYGFISKPPWPEPYPTGQIVKSCRISSFILIIQWVIVSTITGGLIITFKDKKPKDQQKE